MLLWPVEAHPALGTWAQLSLSLLAVSLVSECLLPAVRGLLPDIHLQKCPVPLVFVLALGTVWGQAGHPGSCAGTHQHPSLILSGCSRHCHLASLQALPSILSCFCRT